LRNPTPTPSALKRKASGSHSLNVLISRAVPARWTRLKKSLLTRVSRLHPSRANLSRATISQQSLTLFPARTLKLKIAGSQLTGRFKLLRLLHARAAKLTLKTHSKALKIKMRSKRTVT
jgi:hypothetical protein